MNKKSGQGIRIYKMEEWLLDKFKERDGNFCRGCREEIKVGDTVVSKYSSKNKRRLYHEKCALELNIIIQISDSKEDRE